MIVVLSDTRGIYLEQGMQSHWGKIIGLRIEETIEFTCWGYEFFDYILSTVDEIVKIIQNR